MKLLSINKLIAACMFSLMVVPVLAAVAEPFVVDFRITTEAANVSVPPGMLQEALKTVGIERFYNSYNECNAEPVNKVSGEPITAVLEAKLYHAPYADGTVPLVSVTVLECDAPFWSQHSLVVLFKSKDVRLSEYGICAKRIREFVTYKKTMAFVGECGGNAQGFNVTKAQLINYGDDGLTVIDDYGFVRIDGCGVGGAHANISSSTIQTSSQQSKKVTSFRKSCRGSSEFVKFSEVPLEAP